MVSKAALLFLLVALFHGSKTFGQHGVFPGGVKNPMVWLRADSNAKVPNFKGYIRTRDSVITLSGKPAIKKLNFNSAITFGGKDFITIPLGDSSLSNATFFTVYQRDPESTKEGAIWHVSKLNNTALVLTTSRLADLESYSYMNYNDIVPSFAKVNSYIQLKERDSIFPKKQYWKIGSKPAIPELPITSFKGLIPEFIAYNTALNIEDRLKVASYLAMKYGITLSDPDATYLNSQGGIIWNGFDFKNYYHHIAGIGRDDASGLLQRKSTSSNTPGLLTIATDSIVDDGGFLLWGENDKPFSRAPRKNGVPTMLEKKWLLSSTGNRKPLQTQVILDTRLIDAALPVKPIYWLAIDRTGTDDFSKTETEFIKMDSVTKEGKAYYNHILWGTKGSDKEIMGFMVAKDLLTTTSITAPSCSNVKGGSLLVKMLGGQPPFHLRLSDQNSKEIYNKTTKNLTEKIEGITSGQYTITVSAEAGTYTDVVTVNNIDAPRPVAVLDQYSLTRDKDLIIRADSTMPAGLSYAWSGPNGFRSSNAEIKITQAGKYTLVCSNNGCSYVQYINIAPPTEGDFSQILVYPNPSSGEYTADVMLAAPVPMEVSIYYVDGKKISSWRGEGNANYRVSGTLRLPGLYVITFKSGTSVATRKIIIVN